MKLWEETVYGHGQGLYRLFQDPKNKTEFGVLFMVQDINENLYNFTMN